MTGDRFARLVFRLAGILGVALIAPMYFLERTVSEMQPPAITHPEHFYGFIGVTLAWQVVYLVISTDPVRYRPLMPVGVFAKLTFVIAVAALWSLDRIASDLVWISLFDWICLALFVAAYVRTSGSGRAKSPGASAPQTSL